jgi:SPP1 family predicted phage head-tail adaptor
MHDPSVIEAGTLRNAISIQQQTTTQDEYGQQQTLWVSVLETRATIRTLTLAERSSASGFVSEATHRITLRYQPTVALVAGMRVIHDSQSYILQAIENVLERNRVLTCLALELTPTR